MTYMLAGAGRRYAMNAPVELTKSDCPKAAGLMIELTQDSARVSQLEPGSYAPGDCVTVTCPCGRIIEAFVQSIIGGRAKLRFATALHLPELAEMLDANRSNAAFA